MTEVTESVAALDRAGDGLLVAFASMDGDMVEQHFGSSQAFYVYRIGSDSAELLTSKQFGIEKKDGNEDKLKPKLAWLNGCDIVYCASIGGSATRQLIALGITPQQVTGGPDVEELVEDLQSQLRGEPEFWLAKILRQKQKNALDDDFFDSLEEEGWE